MAQRCDGVFTLLPEVGPVDLPRVIAQRVRDVALAERAGAVVSWGVEQEDGETWRCIATYRGVEHAIFTFSSGGQFKELFAGVRDLYYRLVRGGVLEEV
jgi:hypothetical protein